MLNLKISNRYNHILYIHVQPTSIISLQLCHVHKNFYTTCHFAHKRPALINHLPQKKLFFQIKSYLKIILIIHLRNLYFLLIILVILNTNYDTWTNYLSLVYDVKKLNCFSLVPLGAKSFIILTLITMNVEFFYYSISIEFSKSSFIINSLWFNFKVIKNFLPKDILLFWLY